MTNKLNEKFITGFGLSFAITSIVSSLLVILKETFETLKDFMASLTGHHWITQGVFTILLFVILGFVLSKDNIVKKVTILRLQSITIISALLGPLIIFVFYLVKL